jgi:hypothetical protein
MVRSFSSNSAAGFDVDEGQGKKQNPYPDNNDVHYACSLLPLFTLRLQKVRNTLKRTAAFSLRLRRMCFL